MSLTVALDTSMALTCAGLIDSDGQYLEAVDVPTSGSRPNHATAGLALLSELMHEAGAQWSDIERVVVGVGPGSFTGLRVGVATALGLGKGSAAEVVGVSSLSALSHAAGGSSVVCSLIDARRAELFALLPGSEEAVCVSNDVTQLSIPAGTLCVGDGAQLMRGALKAMGLEVAADDSGLHRVSPQALINLADQGHSVLPSLPLYVREADAVPTSERARP